MRGGKGWNKMPSIFIWWFVFSLHENHIGNCTVICVKFREAVYPIVHCVTLRIHTMKGLTVPSFLPHKTARGNFAARTSFMVRSDCSPHWRAVRRTPGLRTFTTTSWRRDPVLGTKNDVAHRHWDAP